MFLLISSQRLPLSAAFYNNFHVASEGSRRLVFSVLIVFLSASSEVLVVNTGIKTFFF